MKLNRSFIAAATALASLQMVSAADIVGKITLKGTPPAEKEIPLDAACGKLHTEKLKTRLYVVGADGGLADAFVYIKDGLTGKTFEVPSQPVVVDQKGCEYTPYVSGVQTGQTVLVKNSDPVPHNVHPTPAVAGNKESNLFQGMGAKPLTYTFAKQEILLRYKCDIHNWMFAYVGVVDHPYYSVSAKDGTFKIANVPAGSYTVEVYHRKAGKSTQKVTVGNDGAKANFTLEVPAPTP